MLNTPALTGAELSSKLKYPYLKDHQRFYFSTNFKKWPLDDAKAISFLGQRFLNWVRGPLGVHDDCTGAPWLRPGQSINERLSRLAKSPGNSLQRNYEKKRA